MFKEFSIDNWILGGSVFILIFALGCYFWFQNEMASIQQDVNPYVKTQLLEKSSETRGIEPTDIVQPDTYKENSSDSEDTSVVTPNVSSTQQKKIQIGEKFVSLVTIGSNQGEELLPLERKHRKFTQLKN